MRMNCYKIEMLRIYHLKEHLYPLIDTSRRLQRHYVKIGVLAILPLSRQYKADRYYNIKRLNSKFACDTIWADIKYLNQHKYAQIFTHKYDMHLPESPRLHPFTKIYLYHPPMFIFCSSILFCSKLFTPLWKNRSSN